MNIVEFNTNTTVINTKEKKMNIEATVNAFWKETEEVIKTSFTKEEYLEWKLNWKYLYKELSAAIRDGKAKRKGVPNGYVYGLNTLRHQANTMMEMRVNMKEKAKELKETANA